MCTWERERERARDGARGHTLTRKWLLARPLLLQNLSVLLQALFAGQFSRNCRIAAPQRLNASRRGSWSLQMDVQATAARHRLSAECRLDERGEGPAGRNYPYLFLPLDKNTQAGREVEEVENGFIIQVYKRLYAPQSLQEQQHQQNGGKILNSDASRG